MISIQEEYKINRIRVMANLIEAGMRQEARGQKAWAKNMILQDMQRAEPLLNITQEAKEIFQELGLQVVYKTETPEQTWQMQRIQEEKIKKRVVEDKMDLIKGGNLKIDAGLIPLHPSVWHFPMNWFIRVPFWPHTFPMCL